MNKNRVALPSDFTNSKIAESDDGSDIDITAILRTLWRGKFWIVFCALLGLAAGLYQTRYHTSPLYLANATLALEVAQERLVNFESVTGGFGGDDAAITTEIEVIRSRGMLTKLADELNLINHPHFNAALRLDDPKTPIEAFRAGVEEWLVDRAWMTPGGVK